MFDLAVITDQISMDFEKAVKFIGDLGADSVEIHSLWDKNIEELTEDEANKAKKLLKQYQLNVTNISSTVFLQCPLTGQNHDFKQIADHFISICGDYAFHLKALDYCMKLAELFHTDLVRIFGFEQKRSMDNSEIIDVVSDRLGPAVEKAEKNGITLILENCPFSYMNEAMLIRKVIENIGSKNLKALWDPGNLLRVKNKNLVPFPDEYHAIKDYIAHMHAKDVKATVPGGEQKIVPLGLGEVAYEEIFHALKQDQYQGYISLETELFSGKEGLLEDIRQSYEFLSKKLKTS